MKRFAVIAVLLALMAGEAWGATWTVCTSGCDYADVNAVFDAKDLSGGDIVEIQADTAGGVTNHVETIVWGSNDGGALGNHVTLRGRAGDVVTLTPASSGRFAVDTNYRSYITISNLSFVDAPYYSVYVRGNSRDVTVDGCNFYRKTTPDDTGVHVEIETGNTTGVSHVAVQNSYFTGTTIAAIRVYQQAFATPGRITGITSYNNTFEDVYTAFTYLAANQTTADPGSNGDEAASRSMSGLFFDSNTISGTTYPAVWIASGLKSGEATSRITNNTFSDIGDPSTGLINSLQLNWVRDTFITDNVIDKVHTSICDGKGIILDYAWTDEDCYTSGVTVLRNTLKNIQPICAGVGGGGIALFRSKGSWVGYNIIYNCTTGIRVTGNSSCTGNTIFNNTVVYNIGDGIDMVATGVTPYFVGNIVAFNGGEGVDNDSGTSLFWHYNIIHGNTGGNYSGVDPDDGVGNLASDPLFLAPASNNYRLRYGSPAINAGTNDRDGDGVDDLVVRDMAGRLVDDGKPDIGAYEFWVGRYHHLNPKHPYIPGQELQVIQ